MLELSHSSLLFTEFMTVFGDVFKMFDTLNTCVFVCICVCACVYRAYINVCLESEENRIKYLDNMLFNNNG